MDRGARMASAMMAWVWIGFTLAQLNNAESHRSGRRHFGGHDQFFDGNKQLFAAAPEDRTNRSYLAPVWNFLQGEDPLLTLTLFSPTSDVLKSKHFINLENFSRSTSKVNYDETFYATLGINMHSVSCFFFLSK